MNEKYFESEVIVFINNCASSTAAKKKRLSLTAVGHNDRGKSPAFILFSPANLTP